MVYEQLKKVPKGKVVTYRDLALSLNSIAYRAVGNAMRNNQDPKNVPCYKVIKNSGDIGGYCGSINGKNIKRKIELLKKDGIEVRNNKVNLKKYGYKFLRR